MPYDEHNIQLDSNNGQPYSFITITTDIISHALVETLWVCVQGTPTTIYTSSDFAITWSASSGPPGAVSGWWWDGANTLYLAAMTIGAFSLSIPDTLKIYSCDLTTLIFTQIGTEFTFPLVGSTWAPVASISSLGTYRAVRVTARPDGSIVVLATNASGSGLMYENIHVLISSGGIWTDQIIQGVSASVGAPQLIQAGTITHIFFSQISAGYEFPLYIISGPYSLWHTSLVGSTIGTMDLIETQPNSPGFAGDGAYILNAPLGYSDPNYLDPIISIPVSTFTVSNIWAQIPNVSTFNGDILTAPGIAILWGDATQATWNLISWNAGVYTLVNTLGYVGCLQPGRPTDPNPGDGSFWCFYATPWGCGQRQMFTGVDAPEGIYLNETPTINNAQWGFRLTAQIIPVIIPEVPNNMPMYGFIFDGPGPEGASSTDFVYELPSVGGGAVGNRFY